MKEVEEEFLVFFVVVDVFYMFKIVIFFVYSVQVIYRYIFFKEGIFKNNFDIWYIAFVSFGQFVGVELFFNLEKFFIVSKRNFLQRNFLL